jgi:hypothetical protein
MPRKEAMKLAYAAILAACAGIACGQAVPPAPIQNWLDSMPQQNVGTLYMTTVSPSGMVREHKMQAWGQLCDGNDHLDFVKSELYNEYPNHGKGYRYIKWRCVPDNPKRNKNILSGKANK